MPQVSPEVLAWARQTAGLTRTEAAAKAQLKATKLQTAEERIAALEDGTFEPSRPLLLKLAAAYRRPLLTFYLPRPPAEAKRVEDFRTLPDRAEGVGEATLQTLVRDVRARQEVVRSLLEELEIEGSTLVARLTMQAGPDAVRQFIVDTLGFSRAEFRRARQAEQAFDYLRSLAEKAGVFVLLAGNLGSFHTDLDTASFRGFALADVLAPFVVVNDKDAKTAWSFTLLHELVHIVLGTSGISGARFEGEVEKFCNDVASGILLDERELAELVLPDGELADLLRAVADFARVRNLSGSLVAYRLYLAGIIDRADWDLLGQAFTEAFHEARRARPPGQPNYYIVRRHRLGKALLDLMDVTMQEGLITPTKAGQVLGVKPRNVQTLLSMRAA